MNLEGVEVTKTLGKPHIETYEGLFRTISV